MNKLYLSYIYLKNQDYNLDYVQLRCVPYKE